MKLKIYSSAIFSFCLIARPLGILTILTMLTMVGGCENPGGTQATGGSSNPVTKVKLTEITADNFEELVQNSDQPVLLDFWAPWCGPCVALTPTIEAMAAKYDGKIKVYKVNVDDNEMLSTKFKIDTIPRLIYFSKGEVVITDGACTPDAIEKEINEVVAAH